MYSRIFEGVKIRISDKNYKLLLRRFNKHNFVKSTTPVADYSSEVRNKIPCALCESFSNKRDGKLQCNRCPFAVFKTFSITVVGCNYVIGELIPYGRRVIHTTEDSVMYRISDEEKAFKNLEVITEFLESFKKEKSNG